MSSSPDELLTPGEASKLLNVTIRTLLKWDYKGKINCIRTEGGHRRFLKSDLLSIAHKKQPNVNGRKICYCRVSSSSQKEDLERQFTYLRNKFPDHEIIKDIGSALNFKRKVLRPFWTTLSKKISQKLWLPTKIDFVDSVLSSSRESSLKHQMGKSWFSIEKKLPLKKNLPMILSPS